MTCTKKPLHKLKVQQMQWNTFVFSVCCLLNAKHYCCNLLLPFPPKKNNTEMKQLKPTARKSVQSNLLVFIGRLFFSCFCLPFIKTKLSWLRAQVAILILRKTWFTENHGVEALQHFTSKATLQIRPFAD